MAFEKLTMIPDPRMSYDNPLGSQEIERNLTSSRK